jgi:hypothetical protein
MASKVLCAGIILPGHRYREIERLYSNHGAL